MELIKYPIYFSLSLLLLQILHLTWLTTDIILQWGLFTEVWSLIFISLDYLEIPALASGILTYLLIMRKEGVNIKSILFTNFLFLQFFHIFWLTDDVIAVMLVQKSYVDIPLHFAYFAIFIDFAEVIVIYDFIKRLIRK